MIPPPSIEEIQCAFNEARAIYPPIKGIKSKILLSPHAGVSESRIVTATTLLYLFDDATNILLLGTNHKGVKLPFPLTIINDTTEHSLTINREFLSYVNKSCDMALLDPDADSDAVAILLVNWLQQNANNVLIVSSDLSHYNTNQEENNRNEDPLIQGLIDGNINLTDNSFNKVNACGESVLRVVSRIANILELKGIVTCYNDSCNKASGWYTIDGPSEVSYLGMIWINPGLYQIDLISSFDQQHLTAFAKSCVIATLLSAPLPDLPLWSKWNKFYNGVFVGIKDKNGNTRASIGHYQSFDRNLVFNVKRSAVGTVQDASSRWKRRLRIEDIESYIFYINILEDIYEWKEYIPSHLIDKTAPSDNYGFYLQIGNLEATFLPSVWSDMISTSGDTSLQTLMTELTRKAGGSGSEWKNTNARVKLYSTLYIELYIPNLC